MALHGDGATYIALHCATYATKLLYIYLHNWYFSHICCYLASFCRYICHCFDFLLLLLVYAISKRVVTWKLQLYRPRPRPCTVNCNHHRTNNVQWTTKNLLFIFAGFAWPTWEREFVWFLCRLSWTKGWGQGHVLLDRDSWTCEATIIVGASKFTWTKYCRNCKCYTHWTQITQTKYAPTRGNIQHLWLW
jgi:hypothetical protein